MNQGWICYAEKQLGSFVLPYVSSVKSPQQTIGAAIKHHLCQALGLRYCGTLEILVIIWLLSLLFDLSVTISWN